MPLNKRHILVGITGGIAAYKTASLVRLLVKAGAEVKVIMTEAAQNFVTPLTFSVLSKNPVFTTSHQRDTGEWNSHVELGQWADLFVIAPASANTLAKATTGIADNLLLTTYLSAKCPVAFAPAMDLDMYAHETTQKNLATLKKRGHLILEPTSGELASGLSGTGRMQEPEDIFDAITKVFQKKKSFSKKSFLITSGPTYEAIDPVRFIGNHSSGKMGIALAEELAQRGASVFLITGPTHQPINHPAIKRIDVLSADEMYAEAIKLFPKVNGAIMAAAVADYKVKHKAKTKLKRTGDELTLTLIPNQDIAAALGKQKKEHQVIVGFALETNDEENHATKKLTAKNLDFIVLNSLKDKGAGFGTDTNKITIIDRKNNIRKFELKEKSKVAQDIIDYLENWIK